MDSKKLQILHDSLRRTTLSIIKEKVSCKVIIFNKEGTNLKIGDSEYINIIEITCDYLKLNDDSLLFLENIKNILVLIDILKIVEKWIKIKRKDYIEIQWSVDDFEQCAIEQEETDIDNIRIYNRSKFRKALKKLEYHYDCNNGISWEDIKNHLDMYCKI